jgi:hypothetical protein
MSGLTLADIAGDSTISVLHQDRDQGDRNQQPDDREDYHKDLSILILAVFAID